MIFRDLSSQRELVDQLVAAGTLRDSLIIDSFHRTDRASFVPEDKSDEAYNDYPLPIGYGATISQPTTVAMMLEWLEPKPGQKILDIGSGSGWTTALLAHVTGMAGSVIGIDIVPQLVEIGKRNISKYGFQNAMILQADGVGHMQEAPYDRILVSASSEDMPDLLPQLKEGGIIVVPIRDAIHKIRKDGKGKIKEEIFPGFVFVPLRP